MKRFWRRAENPAQTAASPSADAASSEAFAQEAPVAGERARGSVHRALSLQSRLSNGLAFALMAGLGVSFLGWYYVRTLSDRTGDRTAAQSAAKSKAQGEMTLPPLGRIDPPAVAPLSTLERALGPPPEAPPDLDQDWPSAVAAPASASASTAPAGKTPEQLLLERRLSGRVFAPAGERGASTSREVAPLPAPRTDTAQPASTVGAAGDLAALLTTRVTPAVAASVLPTMRLLLPKGAFVDCTLETAIDSSLPGMTTCVTATDTFGVDGSVVLLERGTKLVGETRGQLRQGLARVFVVWTEARTPTGVVVPLASPGTDELGRSGLPGEVDRHFWERFGAAMLVSVIDGAVQAGVAAQREDGGTVILNPSASSTIMTEVLRSTIDIPPTVTKAQGDRIQVLVARDLDFRSVYALRALDAER